MNAMRLCPTCSELLTLPPWLFEYGIRCTPDGHEILFNLEHYVDERERYLTEAKR